MSYSNVQTSGKQHSANNVLAFSFVSLPTANNLVTVRVWTATNGNDTFTGNEVADNKGNTFSHAWVPTTDSTIFGAVGIYYLVAPAGLSGTYTVTITNPSTLNEFGVFDEWSGNATSSVLDQQTMHLVDTATTTPSTANINTGANAGLALSVLNIDQNPTTISITTASFTEDVSDVAADAGAVGFRTASMASQSGFNCTWSLTGGTNNAAAASGVASFNVSTGAVAAAVLLTRTLRGVGV